MYCYMTSKAKKLEKLLIPLLRKLQYVFVYKLFHKFYLHEIYGYLIHTEFDIDVVLSPIL